MSNEARTAAVDAFWAAFDQAWRAGGARSADDACNRLQMKSNYTLAPATVRDWVRHKRLPRREEDVAQLFLLLVGRQRTDELLEALRAARASRTVDPAPPPPATGEPVRFWRRPVRGRVLRWHVAVTAVLVVGLAGVVIFVPNGRSPASTVTPTSTTPDEAVPDARISPCPSDVVRAVSKKERARAEFCPSNGSLLLHDESLDGKSAILVVRRDGEELPAFFNSNGHGKRNSDGKIVSLPPKPVPFRVDADDNAEFRVCFGDFNEELRYPPETCGLWTKFWSS